MSIASPKIHSTRCARFRYRYSACQRCSDACPHQAIALSDEGVAIDPGKCQNCTLCVTACLTDTFESAQLNRVELLKAAIRPAREAQFSIACTPSQQTADASVPCLGAIDAISLAYLQKRGIAVALKGSEHCAVCVHRGTGEAQIALNLEAAGVLREAAAPEVWPGITLPRPTETDPAPAKSEFKPARRQLFRRFLGRAADEAVRAVDQDERVVPPDQGIRAGAPAVTDPRQIARIVGKKADSSAFSMAAHTAIPALEINLAAGCTACEACFRVCPTAAIKIREDDSSWSLNFEPQNCVGCELCIEVCKPLVLTAAARVDLSPANGERAMHRLQKQRCKICDRFFISPEAREHCVVCTDDEDAFAQIFG
jgi:Fe-S-cluster-containing hydrogenase component 2